MDGGSGDASGTGDGGILAHGHSFGTIKRSNLTMPVYEGMHLCVQSEAAIYVIANVTINR